jgi:hypothetical protein
MRAADLDRCLTLAAQAATGSADAFAREWRSATMEEVVFEHSGYVLASYFLAQGDLNDVSDPFDSPEGLVLAGVFTAAFPARTTFALPELERDALEAFCISEWGEDGVARCEPILAAHEFFKHGMSRITPDTAVVLSSREENPRPSFGHLCRRGCLHTLRTVG